MTKINPHFKEKIAKFTKDESLFNKKVKIPYLPEKGEEGILYQCRDKEYVFLEGEWVYFLIPEFRKPIDSADYRPDPSLLPHGTACLNLENMDVYVVLDGCWACFPMSHFISDEVVG